MSDKVNLIAIAMVRPTSEGIHAPSANRPNAEVEEGEYEKGPIIPVSLAPDGKSDAVPTQTYTISPTNDRGSLILSAFGRFIKR